MRTYRINFGEKERNVLKEMKPRIKKAKENFGRYTSYYPEYIKRYTQAGRS